MQSVGRDAVRLGRRNSNCLCLRVYPRVTVLTLSALANFLNKFLVLWILDLTYRHTFEVP